MNAKADVTRYIDSIRQRLVSVSESIHSHPELSFDEIFACTLLANSLTDAGFDVEKGIAGLPTAIRAVHPQIAIGPTVALIGEYDALPGVGHACGHNLIAAAGLGAALALASIKCRIPGTLVFLGTPAEESGGGKIIMLGAGVFNDIDVAMMFHPAPYTSVHAKSLAVCKATIEFYGKAAHASASPEMAVNALDAVLQTFNGLNGFRQSMKDGARIHGIITAGGVAPNIVPDYASAFFFVRAESAQYRDKLLDKLEACAQGAALATGARLVFKQTGDVYESMRANRSLENAFQRNLVELGVKADPITEDIGKGSTDMGDVSNVIPSIHPYMQICDKNVALHSRGFASAANSSRAQEIMLMAAKALAMTAIDVFKNADLIAQIDEDFEDASLSDGASHSRYLGANGGDTRN